MPPSPHAGSTPYPRKSRDFSSIHAPYPLWASVRFWQLLASSAGLQSERSNRYTAYGADLLERIDVDGANDGGTGRIAAQHGPVCDLQSQFLFG